MVEFRGDLTGQGQDAGAVTHWRLADGSSRYCGSLLRMSSLGTRATLWLRYLEDTSPRV